MRLHVRVVICVSCMLESNACSLVKRGGVLYSVGIGTLLVLGFASWIGSGCGMGQSLVWEEVGGAWLINVYPAEPMQCSIVSIVTSDSINGGA